MRISDWSSDVCSSDLQSGSCTSWGYNGTAFTNIVGRMATMMPEIQAANVAIDYENVGLGYARDPNAPDVAPLVRVRLTGLRFTPTLHTLFGAWVSMSDYSVSHTMADGSATVSKNGRGSGREGECL